MGLTRIGDETWDLVPSEGGETLLPTDAKADVEFPTRWRVFGPTGVDATTVEWSEATDYTYHKHAKPLVSAEVEGLSEIPQTLAIGGQTFERRDADMTDGALDFGALFGGHEAGQQAYAMAEMEVERETEVVFGAGCNWWMQWWIDGEEAFENLAAGNTQGFPFSTKFAINRVSATDHCFRRKLGAGKHLLVVRAISGLTGWVLRAGIASPRDETLCAVLKPNRWHFLTEVNEIRPPEAGRWSHTVAIRTDLCVGDVTMECEFLRPESRGNVGLIFGAQDSDHYYWAQIPGWAQLYRARAQYAAISKTEGTGYIRNLKIQLMHNVPLHGNIWRTLKVERRGSVIQMWVNGVKGPCVHDDTYGAGRIGVAGYSGSHNWAIRNLKINGQPVDAPPWPEGDRRGKPYFEPLADLNPDELQHAFRLFKLSDDEILMVVMTWPGAYNKPSRNPEDFGVYFYSSSDGGRSWSLYAGPLPVDARRTGQWFVPEPGVIRDVTFDQERGQFSLHDSVDKGLTWSEEKAGKLTGGWEEMFAENALGVSKITTLVGIAGLTALQDGTVMAQLSRSYGGASKIMPNGGEGSWGMSNGGQPHCTLSSDQGLTWSNPIPMDYAAQHYGDRSEAPCTDFSETPVAQLPGGRIVAICRPYLSPFMWQTHSDDGGKSWRMACYAPFSGAGGPKLVATRSGYLALIKRGPGLGLNISVDGGLNWDEGTMIDLCTSFNGQAIEAEPDVVLVAHPEGMGENCRFPFRMQRIRITPDGPVSLGTE
jgi:hypothetical protein